MMRVALSISLFAAALAHGLVPLPPGHDDFPEAFQEWGKLNSTFSAMLDFVRPFSESQSNGLPLLPCISQPDVRMRDGTKIYTSLVIPWPCHLKRPAMLVRSPYGPTTRSLALLYAAFGYVAVMQDQRGTFASEGTFDMWQLGNPDGVDAMSWIVNQPWSNGDVFTMGASADGIATLTPLMTPGIPVKGQWTIWATGDGHALSYTGGALRQDLIEGYFNTMSVVTRLESPTVISEVKEHEQYGPWWYNLTDCRDLNDQSVAPGCHYGAVKWPSVITAGWWDILMEGSLKMMNGVLAVGDQRYVHEHVAIIDPLGHCMLTPFQGEGLVEAATLELQTARGLVVGFFASLRAFSKLPVKFPTFHKRLNFFVMGNYEADTRSPRNFWTSLDNWPAYSNKDFFMQGSSGKVGVLTEAASSDTTSMSYVYDPTTKDGVTPMMGGANLPFFGGAAPGGSVTETCGSADQTKRDARDDVLVFDSDILSDDLAVVGNITAKAFVSSDAVDTDFVAIVSDVGPKKVMMVRYGVVRMRWRGSDEKQSPPLEAGKVYEVDISLAATAYIFPKGHRVRVTISSAAYPYFDANPNNGNPLLSAVAAHNAFHMGPNHPSKISLPVVKMQDIPHNRLFGSGLPDPLGLARTIRDTIVV